MPGPHAPRLQAPEARSQAFQTVGEEAEIEVSMAKLYATESANRVAYEAVQFHRGYGYIRETPVERFARDYRVWTIAAGSSEIMREIIAKRLMSG